jgi:hypothetical protein
MASPKLTSLNMVSAAVNSLNIIEQLQTLSISPDNTTVDARGIADRYAFKQVTKQKQSLDLSYHWYDSSTDLEATNLDITVWSIDGSAYLGELKSGTLDITNGAIEVSGIAESYEYVQTTSTEAVVTSNLLIITEGVWTYEMMAATNVSDFAVAVVITFAGESIHIPGVLKSSKHTIRRGEVQMEDVVIELQGTPTTPGDTTSLIYSMLIGSALVPFTVDTGANIYETASEQYAAMTRYNVRFADKNLIEQTLTLELQGGMTVTEGG